MGLEGEGPHRPRFHAALRGLTLTWNGSPNLDPTSLESCPVGAHGFRAYVAHQHAEVLHVRPQHRRQGFVAGIPGNRAREGFAGGNVELCAMHGAGEVDPVERTQFERRIHVTTTPLDGDRKRLFSRAVTS
jgi:hypothetical protein